MRDDFVYVRANINLKELSNGDSFINVDPKEYINKHVYLDFRQDEANKIMGTVLEASGNNKAFDTFIGSYYPEGNDNIEILVKFRNDVPKIAEILEGKNYGFGVSGMVQIENAKIATEIDAVSLISNYGVSNASRIQ